MNEHKNAPFNRQEFLNHFQGMEDLAMEAIRRFLQILPSMLSAIEVAIQSKNLSSLELAAHALKGVLSNFYAEPARLLVWQLEQMGHGVLDGTSEKIFMELQIELERLSQALQALASERQVA